MTPEAQRIAIAEACPRLFHVLGTPNATVVRVSDQSIVDPLNDLNVMHEAEKWLLSQCTHGFEDNLWIEYLNNLCVSAPAGGMHHANAAIRCEAFLRTIGKWQDEKGTK